MVYAGYIRVSQVGDRGERLISPDLQRERIHACAKRHGIEVEILEPELDVSGGRAHRPILDQIIEGIEQGHYGGIVVPALDRLSRLDLLGALQLFERVDTAGGEVLSDAESFDTSTPEGEMGRNVFLSMGRMRRQQVKLQFEAARAQAVARKIWPAIVPIGYRKAEDRSLEPDPDTTPLVRQAFHERAAGAPWSRIAEILSVSVSGARRIVTNRVYLGEITLAKWHNPEGHEALVSREEWEAAQLGHAPPAHNGGGGALLTGIIRCAACRRAMTPSESRRWRIYRCQRRSAAGRCPEPAIITRSLADEYVESVVREHLRIRYRARGRGGEKARLLEKLQEAEAEFAAYQDAVDAAKLGPELVARGLRRRAETIEQIQRELAGIQSTTEAVGELADIVERWNDLPLEDRRHVLRGALGVIWVRKGREPASERIRIIAAGFEPADLPRPGRGGVAPIILIEWPDENLPGEIRATVTKKPA